MKLKNSQALTAIVLSILVHAGVAVLGEYQSGKTGNVVGSLSVKIASHSSNNSAQQSSKPETEQAPESEPVHIAEPVETVEAIEAIEAIEATEATEAFSEDLVADKKIVSFTAKSTAVHEKTAEISITEQPDKTTNKSSGSISDELADNQANTGGETAVEGLVAASIPLVSAMPLYHLIPKPPYPSRSRDLGEEGTVIIAIKVAVNGSVAEAHVSKSSGYSLLDGSALASVKSQWRFKPATRAGKPVATWVRVPITFSINKH